ncbi:MAG: copper homeostasis protein CutC [Odoribacter sp.]
MKRDEFQIEICANSVESAVEAARGGADRIELCAGMPEGGTTPSYGEIALARELLSIRLHIIIRPRGGDFLYTPMEREVMLRDIATARHLGVDGVVVGCLTPNGKVDIGLMHEMMKAAGKMSVTFHRAFDMCDDPFEALEAIEALGCDRILTSGQCVTAEDGCVLLKQLVERSQGVIIMPGCGVNAANICRIAEETGAAEFHFSARVAKESDMLYRNSRVSMGGTVRIEEYGREMTSADRVKEVIEALQIHH